MVTLLVLDSPLCRGFQCAYDYILGVEDGGESKLVAWEKQKLKKLEIRGKGCGGSRGSMHF